MKHMECKRRSRAKSLLAGFLATCLAFPVNAVDIPRVPPSSGNGIPPNILFILDDSGSMAWSAMPHSSRHSALDDDITDRSYVHNTVYYNPAITYRPWLGADGKRLTGGTTYGSAYADLNRAEKPINLASSNSCRDVDENSWNDSYKVCGGTQIFFVPKDTTRTDSAYLNQKSNYYRFRINTDAQIWRYEWISNKWDNPTRATPTATRDEAAELDNFATWFSYHRSRMKAAKAGASEAFGALDGDKYRVGFTTIWGPDGGGIDNKEFLIPVGTDNGLFRGKNRSTWFSRLFAARGYNGTPLRRALTRAGEYYSKSGSSGPYGGHLDEEGNQFQCRQNFSILTTDGFWNGGNPSGVSNADNASGPTVNGPLGADGTPTRTFTYSPAAPYKGSDSVTLADVAMHYWKNDLRTDMANVVPFSAANPAFWQHMVTFGISIGLKGTVDQTSVREVVEYGGVSKNGTKLTDWPDPTDSENQERIDDLLHAAVNGRGEFVAASDPDAFRQGLQNALAAIAARTTSASNVGTSSTSLSTDSRLFEATYIGGQWSGELKAVPIVDRKPVPGSPVWQASAQMPTSAATRKVFTSEGSGGKAFTYDAVSSAIRNAMAVPTAVGFDDAATLARARIDYVRGAAQHEMASGGPFRNRLRPVAGRVPLGDIIHSSPYHLPSPDKNGTDALFVGANDGMLHAFDAASGQELFGYVPKGTNWTRLVEFTSPEYKHAYFVDGPVTVSNRAVGLGKNVLVGAMGRGGKGVFALDVTSPEAFAADKVMWDITTQADTDPDLGHVLGRPFIANLNNERPAVIFGNGPNSASGTAALYIIDLITGAQLAKLDTKVAGDNALAAPTGWDADGDGTVDAVYAGDMKGNVWKFDLSDKDPGKWTSAYGSKDSPAPMFVATDADGNRQPITGAVSVAIDPANYRRWILFGTGRMYNDADLWNANGSVNLAINSIYGIKEPDSALGLRSAIDGTSTGLAVRTIAVAGLASNGMPVRGFQPSDTELGAKQQGWVVDLVEPPHPPGTPQGERVIGDVQVIGGTMVFSSMLPSTNPCLPGGRGYLNALNAFTGASVPEHFFDVDGDGEYSDDNVGGGGDEGGGDGSVPVGSVDLGVGNPTDPGWMTPLVCVNGSAGQSGCLSYKSNALSGRISWREILRN